MVAGERVGVVVVQEEVREVAEGVLEGEEAINELLASRRARATRRRLMRLSIP